MSSQPARKIHSAASPGVPSVEVPLQCRVIAAPHHARSMRQPDVLAPLLGDLTSCVNVLGGTWGGDG
jgi:hypothetical protein